MKRCLLLLPFLLLLGCGKEPDPIPTPTPPNVEPAPAKTDNVAVLWGRMTLQTMYRLPANTPTYGSRALGYAGLTMYECAVNGSTNRRSMSGQLSGLTNLPQPEVGQTYNYALALNAGQAYILKHLFDYAEPTRMARIDSLEMAISTAASATVSTAVMARSATYGQAVAEAIFNWSKTDGGFEGYKRIFDYTYKVPTGPGYWVAPLMGQVTSNVPMHPYWGKNRTFVDANSQLPVPTMVPYSGSVGTPCYTYNLEVYEKSKSLTADEKAIAGWWADDPTETFSPPGHSYSLAGIVAQTAKADLYGAAETYARVGMAVADAFVNGWKAKYTYHCARPSTYVRANIDPNWVQFWPEPPFPAFYSGHAVQSAASATVLERLYGKSFAFIDNSHQGRPRDVRGIDYLPRTFTSFWASAQEAAQSRFYGGIHTQQDNMIGLAEGQKIGQNINALSWQK
jgi:PAP2 superfamily